VLFPIGKASGCPSGPSPSPVPSSDKPMYGTEGNMTNGQSGKGNGFADRCVKAYDQLVLGKESNMIVGTVRTGAVISVFVIVAALFFYLIR
jgi:hypothetical protein